MSRREILEDFYILGRKYEEGGDCCLAAAEAWEFYNRLHTLMRPKLVTGILYSDSVMPKLKKTGISPRCLAGISPLYQAFRLEVQHISSHVVLVVIAQQAATSSPSSSEVPPMSSAMHLSGSRALLGVVVVGILINPNNNNGLGNFIRFDMWVRPQAA